MAPGDKNAFLQSNALRINHFFGKALNCPFLLYTSFERKSGVQKRGGFLTSKKSFCFSFFKFWTPFCISISTRVVWVEGQAGNLRINCCDLRFDRCERIYIFAVFSLATITHFPSCDLGKLFFNFLNSLGILN